MMHECVLQARTMGYKAVYTDHSLFGFSDAASIHLNKLMKFTLSDINHAICVSHTCRENLVLRASLDPASVSTIPNAVDSSRFTPDPSRQPTDDRINIVIISRLVYRKGIDLVVKTIPMIADKYPNVYFIIGGEGNKKLLLEEMRERHRLHDRIELLGAVPHTNVRNVLCRGHIFLNSSLTESFCIALLEAACCGLFVVSTKVGGVSEVLPPDLIQFSSEPSAEALAEAIEKAIPKVSSLEPWKVHERIRKMYNWHDVAKRTEIVYEKVRQEPRLHFVDRLTRYYSIGPYAGGLACILVVLLHLYCYFLNLCQPIEKIETVPDLELKRIRRSLQLQLSE